MSHARPPRFRSGFSRDTGGISAVEFALVLPFMLALFVGGSELSRAIDNARKVTLLARTVVDLTSQGDTTNPIRSATMQDILSSAALVLAPYNSGSAGIIVSAIGVYPAAPARAYVCSSTALNATARTARAAATDIAVPTGFQTGGMRYILAEVTMPYQPMLGSAVLKFFSGSAGFTFRAALPWPVRAGTTYNSTYAEILLPGGEQCPTTT